MFRFSFITVFYADLSWMGNFDHFALKPSYLVGTPSAAKRYSPRVVQIHVTLTGMTY